MLLRHALSTRNTLAGEILILRRISYRHILAKAKTQDPMRFCLCLCKHFGVQRRKMQRAPRIHDP